MVVDARGSPTLPGILAELARNYARSQDGSGDVQSVSVHGRVKERVGGDMRPPVHRGDMDPPGEISSTHK